MTELTTGGQCSTLLVSLLTQDVQMVFLTLMVIFRKWWGIKYTTIGKITLINQTQSCSCQWRSTLQTVFTTISTVHYTNTKIVGSSFTLHYLVIVVASGCWWSVRTHVSGVGPLRGYWRHKYSGGNTRQLEWTEHHGLPPPGSETSTSRLGDSWRPSYVRYGSENTSGCR